MHAGLKGNGLKSFFTYFAVPLIICAVLLYVAWYYIFEWINNVHDWEKISLFIEAEGLKDNIVGDLYDYLSDEENTPDPVKEVDLYTYSRHTNNLYDIYLSRGVYADLLILTVDDLIDMEETIDYNFIPITDEVLTFSNLTYLKDNVEFYDYGGVPYGIKIYDPEDEEYNQNVGFTEWLDYTDEFISYYLVINLFSANIMEFEESARTNNAFVAMNYLFTRYTSFS